MKPPWSAIKRNRAGSIKPLRSNGIDQPQNDKAGFRFWTKARNEPLRQEQVTDNGSGRKTVDRDEGRKIYRWPGQRSGKPIGPICLWDYEWQVTIASMRRRDEGLALQIETKTKRNGHGDALMAEWGILGKTSSMVKRRVSDTYLFLKSRMTDHLAHRQSYNIRWGLQCFQPQTINLLTIDPQIAYRPVFRHCFCLRLVHVVEFWFLFCSYRVPCQCHPVSHPWFTECDDICHALSTTNLAPMSSSFAYRTP